MRTSVKNAWPAALCWEVALAEDGGEIETWRDGKQTRSFLYVDDWVEGIDRPMRSDAYGREITAALERAARSAIKQ